MPSGVKLSCMALTEPFEAAVVAVAHSAELPTPKRTSLPSMLPADWSIGSADELRIAADLGTIGERQRADEQHRHGGENRDALAHVLHHAAEHEAEGSRDQQDEDHLEKVGERRRVLVRMRGVDVEEAAAIGAELLDGELRSDRALRDYLLAALERRRMDIARQGSAARPARRGTAPRRSRAAAARRGRCG